MMYFKRHRRGFSLIEVLIVIGILSILIASAMFYLRNSLPSARNTQRKNDLKQYAIALESFANANNTFYPLQLTAVRASTTLCTAATLAPYLTPTCPEDSWYIRDNTFVYLYSSGVSPNATNWVLWSKLEGTPIEYWVACANGKKGEITSNSLSISDGICPPAL